MKRPIASTNGRSPTTGRRSSAERHGDGPVHPEVEKKLQSLPNDVESRIRSKLGDAEEEPGRFLKPLKSRDEYSLRIGKRRAIVDWDRDRDELRVFEVDTRDNVYE